ncbi:hypothetical protein ACQEVB_14240 [Pseudonocardia sp. CA-107938]|uniref:hypothetical protein n=1 Tax=Pseudonocardia sp. CA-107938 TaxID=3240021 RepID=UPI003D92D4C8
MDHHDAEQHWPLRGFWRAWLWISVAIAGALGLLGLTALTFVWWLPFPAGLILLVPGAVLVAVGVVIGWQVSNTVLDATLAADGTLTLRRVGRVLRTHAARVQLVRFSVLVSRPHTPIVIETADGSVTVLHARREADELIAALRRYNPRLPVHL